MSVLRRMSVSVVVATVLLGVLTVAPASARPSVVRTTISCGQTVTTSIVVANDLTCASAPILNITGSGITINLDGHRITGRGVGSYCKVNANYACDLEIRTGSTITNGRLSNLSVGLGPSVDATVGSGLAVQDGSVVVLRSRAELRASRITDSLVLLLRGRGTVTHNKFLRSNIRIDDVEYGVGPVITDNSLVDSPLTDPEIKFSDPGWLPQVYGAISVSSSMSWQYDIVGEISRNRISGSAGDGIAIRGFQYMFGTFLIGDNQVHNNLGNGISVLSPVPRFPPPWGLGGPITLSGNTALRNGGNGIIVDSATAEIVDGGGNQARRNALDPQCVGLVCARTPRSIPSLLSDL
jgi:hypothetical protein